MLSSKALFSALLALLLPVFYGPLPLPVAELWPLAPLLLFLAVRCPGWRVPVACLAAVIYSSCTVSAALDSRYQGAPRTLTGVFEVTLVTARASAGMISKPLRFEARLMLPGAAADEELVGRRFRFAWYGATGFGEAFRTGTRAWLRVQLREPWGQQNLGGFDYQRWLFSRHLAGVGYVRGGFPATVQPEAAEPGALQTSLRWWEGGSGASPRTLVASLRHAVGRLLDGRHNARWLRALFLGDRSGLTTDDWTLLRRTGTVHLLIVSGLHVGVMAAFGYLLGLGLGRLVLLPSGIDTRYPGALLAAVISLLYVLVTGFGIPAQRAWLMTNVGLLLLLFGRPAQRLQQVLAAALLILLIDPLAALQAGFWLSFGAVAWLLTWFLPKVGAVRGWRALLSAQLVVGLGLLPLLWCFGHPTAPAGPLVNLVAVPLVSLLIVPTGFVALCLAFWPQLSSAVLWCTDQGMDLLLWLLALCNEAPLWLVPTPWYGPLLVCGLLGCCWWRPERPGSLLLLLAVVFCSLYWPPPRPAVGVFWVTALDVGQGDAILVETHSHTLLFDSGPAFPGGASAAESAVLPVLRARRHRQLDALVISHDDLDHAGGEADLLTAGVVRQRWRSRIHTGSDVAKCERGVRWVWDAVLFEFLHPTPATLRDGGNASSCVLLIRDQSTSARALLPGDIDVSVEHRLPFTGDPVPTLLLAPHHGSSTSSGLAFLRRLNPSLVFVSTAKYSRFGHPHPSVLARYDRLGVPWAVTGQVGALRWESDKPKLFRKQRCRAPYWARLSAADCQG